MKIMFSWYLDQIYGESRFHPIFLMTETPDGCKGCLSSLMTDDEGLGLPHLIEWVANGLSQIERVRSGELTTFNWWGQAWGAEVSLRSVKIYWGYDEAEYEDVMDFNNFYDILTKWNGFIKSQPALDTRVEFDVS